MNVDFQTDVFPASFYEALGLHVPEHPGVAPEPDASQIDTYVRLADPRDPLAILLKARRGTDERERLACENSPVWKRAKELLALQISAVHGERLPLSFKASSPIEIDLGSPSTVEEKWVIGLGVHEVGTEQAIDEAQFIELRELRKAGFPDSPKHLMPLPRSRHHALALRSQVWSRRALENGDEASALFHLEWAIQHALMFPRKDNPLQAELFLAQAELLKKMGFYLSAAWAIKQAAASSPPKKEMALAWEHLHLWALSVARARTLKMARTPRDLLHPFLTKGKAKFTAKKYEEARAALLKVMFLGLEAGNGAMVVTASRILGTIKSKDNLYAEHLEKCRGLGLLVEHGRREEAQDLLTEMQAIHPDLVECRGRLGDKERAQWLLRADDLTAKVESFFDEGSWGPALVVLEELIETLIIVGEREELIAARRLMAHTLRSKGFRKAALFYESRAFKLVEPQLPSPAVKKRRVAAVREVGPPVTLVLKPVQGGSFAGVRRHVLASPGGTVPFRQLVGLAPKSLAFRPPGK